MSSFVVKQIVSKQFDSVKGVVANLTGKEEAQTSAASTPQITQNIEGIDEEAINNALREAEDRRKEKHEIIESEREVLRQAIREKYNINSKSNHLDISGNRTGRSSRSNSTLTTPRNSACEMNSNLKDRPRENSFPFSEYVPNQLRELADKATDVPGKIVDEVTEKCKVM